MSSNRNVPDDDIIMHTGLIGDFNFAGRLKGREKLLSCQMCVQFTTAQPQHNTATHGTTDKTRQDKTSAVKSGTA